MGYFQISILSNVIASSFKRKGMSCSVFFGVQASRSLYQLVQSWSTRFYVFCCLSSQARLTVSSVTSAWADAEMNDQTKLWTCDCSRYRGADVSHVSHCWWDLTVRKHVESRRAQDKESSECLWQWLIYICLYMFYGGNHIRQKQDKLKSEIINIEIITAPLTPLTIIMIVIIIIIRIGVLSRVTEAERQTFSLLLSFVDSGPIESNEIHIEPEATGLSISEGPQLQ